MENIGNLGDLTLKRCITTLKMYEKNYLYLKYFL